MGGVLPGEKRICPKKGHQGVTRKIPEDFDLMKEKFLQIIQATCKEQHIENPSLVVNIDQTGIKLVPTFLLYSIIIVILVTIY